MVPGKGSRIRPLNRLEIDDGLDEDAGGSGAEYTPSLGNLGTG